MTAQLFALAIKARDPRRLAAFWAGVLGRDGSDRGHLLPDDDTGFRIRFRRSQQEKTGLNRMPFDLTSTSLEDQQRIVARSLQLGGRHIDVGQRPEEGHVVLADPEGNEFCVIAPGNEFLAGCGVIGALSCDGSQRVGYFWREAPGRPLVWDQDGETAIQSPRGGPKITWGGPPVKPQTGDHRLRLDLVPAADEDFEAEVERLTSLGASRVETGMDRVVLTDPDGNEFWLLRSAIGRSTRRT